MMGDVLLRVRPSLLLLSLAVGHGCGWLAKWVLT